MMEEEEEDVGESEEENGDGVEEVGVCDCCLGDDIELAMVVCVACEMRESIACPSLSHLNFPRIEFMTEIVCARFGAGQLLSVICVVSPPVVFPWMFMKLW